MFRLQTSILSGQQPLWAHCTAISEGGSQLGTTISLTKWPGQCRRLYLCAPRNMALRHFPGLGELDKGLPRMLWYINPSISSPAEAFGELCHWGVVCTHLDQSSSSVVWLRLYSSQEVILLCGCYNLSTSRTGGQRQKVTSIFQTL